ncbi:MULTISPECIES: hypothetical protein [Catenuloplanes]|uniref:Uncharacterized protein n=1 Tax=Catenuloplanes niger TaxID=587534 RepID=A0AAE3ZSI8_9ACTN|nr:hypothetical protein [Catenuloplanes niger]MDR7323363.1 hypothetical protein [Catenuloplanes niger]
MQDAERVEHWFNGQWGMARKDVLLERDPDGTWAVVGVSRWGQRREERVQWRGLTEDRARRGVDYLIGWAPGPRSKWRPLSR